MMSYSRMAGVECDLKLYGNALIHWSRNAALASFADNADYALFIDDDMLPEPQALCALIQRGQPVVSALCTSRVPPVHIAAKVYHEESDQFIPLDAIRPGALVTGKFATGAAFLLMDRETIGRLKEYFLSAEDWLDENSRLLERLGVRTEKRERERARRAAARRGNWVNSRYLRVFDFPVIENELQLGEDISLSRKLMKLGIPVSIDGAVTVAHLGEHPYGVWDLQYDDHPDSDVR